MKKVKNKKKKTPKPRNVFAELNLPESDDLLVKAHLALHLRRVIKARKIAQGVAAHLIGLNQSRLSTLVNGRIDGFSTDRLMRFLNDLGCDVKITVSAPHPKTRGQLVFN